MPDDCHLAYIVSHEAWYAQTPGVIDRPSISVSASSSGGGVAWEFTVEEYDHGNTHPIRVGMFSDAFDAFAQIPEFFTRLTDGAETLDDVRAILDSIGARDETERREPARYRNSRQASTRERIVAALDGPARDREHIADKVMAIIDADGEK